VYHPPKTPTTIPRQHPPTQQKTKWAMFTYSGPDIRIVTELFRNINLKIAFKTNNTIQCHLKPWETTEDIYNRSGVYQLKCDECPLKYVGQTGHKFKGRFKEHIQAIITENPSSRFAQHMSNTGHLYGTIDQSIKILPTETKG
jgi:hypothetical protein